jgi:hypothetical protein
MIFSQFIQKTKPAFIGRADRFGPVCTQPVWGTQVNKPRALGDMKNTILAIASF